MRHIALVPTFLVALNGLDPAIAKEASPALPLQSGTPWQVDYGKTECRLVRNFGEGDQQASIQISRSGPLSLFNLAIHVPWISRNADLRMAKLKFDGADEWTQMLPGKTTSTEGRTFLIFPRLPWSFWSVLIEQVAANQPVVLRLRIANQEIALNLQKMKALTAQLDKCEDAMMANAGLDGPTLRSLKDAPAAIGSPLDWLRQEDYPPAMLRLDQSGGVLVRLGINETGKVTDCQIMEALGDEAFRKQTCDKLILRARFKPALSAAGTPVKSYSDQTVIWRARSGEGSFVAK